MRELAAGFARQNVSQEFARTCKRRVELHREAGRAGHDHLCTKPVDAASFCTSRKVRLAVRRTALALRPGNESAACSAMTGRPTVDFRARCHYIALPERWEFVNVHSDVTSWEENQRFS